MRKKRLLRIASLLLAVLTVVPLFASCGKQETAEVATPNYTLDEGTEFEDAGSNKYVLLSSNSKYELYVNYYDGTAYVVDKVNNQTWYTNPEDRRNDSVASGYNKNALLSAIALLYTTSTDVEMNVASYMNSVYKKGLTYAKQKDGSVVFKFTFPNEALAVPVRYWIDNDGFHASVLTQYIEETGDNKIKTIELLPFFGAASNKQDGYLFVPDGSGAIISYNNSRLTAKTYEKALYGFDNGTSDRTSGGSASSSALALSENQYMPVFGASTGETGFLGIITGSAARASIKANVSGKYTSYNAVWSKFSYRISGSVNQTQKDGTEQVANIYEHNIEQNDYTVSYYFLNNGSNTYSDMAAVYRNYLIASENLTSRVTSSESVPLYLDTYGYIVKTKSVLGIPADRKITTTSVSDVNEILDILEDSGISNVVVKYNYWSSNSYFGTLPTTSSVDSKVGTKTEMLALQKRLQDAGGRLYLSADLLNAYKTGLSVSKYSDVLKSVANTAQRQYTFTLSTGAIDTRYSTWYLIRPSRMIPYALQYVTNALKAGYTDLSLDQYGTMLYSELSTDGTGRNQVLATVQSLVRQACEKVNSLMVTGANEYVAVSATHILETSFKNSGYDIEDYSVPFYQMVFHGYISYSIGATNLASEPATKTLKCIEYGAAPQFSVIYENADEIIGSRIDSLYSPSFSTWEEFIKTQYEQVNEALSGVQSSTMDSHEYLTDSLVRVIYSNGTVIYVNYGSEAAAADGYTVPATGYTVVTGAGRVLSATALSD